MHGSVVIHSNVVTDAARTHKSKEGTAGNINERRIMK